MSIREEFEKKFPVPEGVRWDETSERYGYTEKEFQPDVDFYNEKWGVWVEAKKSVTPSEYVLMPKSLTAENGAKYMFSGEFFEDVEMPCVSCFDSDDIDEECGICGGEGSFTDTVQVSWSTIKDIYSMAVECLSVNDTDNDETVSQDEDSGYPDCDTCGSPMDYMPWHYATKTERHLHACNSCWPKVNPAKAVIPNDWELKKVCDEENTISITRKSDGVWCGGGIEGHATGNGLRYEFLNDLLTLSEPSTGLSGEDLETIKDVISELSIMSESDGVSGFHLNGDILTWDETEFPKLLEKLQKMVGEDDERNV